MIDSSGRWKAVAMKQRGILSLGLSKDLGMRKLVDRLRRDDEGAALVEYGMLVGLIAVICVAAITTLGTEVSTTFSKIATALSGV
jgi:pilus assembly protein Flp/PilA